MSELAAGVGAVIAVLFVTATLVISNRHSMATEHDRLRYQLFAVRDQLLFMVATDKLSVESKYYQDLTVFINQTIKLTPALSGWSYANYLLSKSRLVRPEDEAEKLFASVPIQSRGEAVELVRRTLATCMDILRCNSLLVRHFHEVLEKIGKTPPPTVMAFELLEHSSERFGRVA